MRKSLRYLLLLPLFSIMLVNCDEDESYKPIEVETKEVISVDYESALVKGKIIEFGKGIDAFGHCWSTDPIPSIEDDTTVVINEVGGDFQSAISELADGEKYYFRSYALNDEEIVYGEIKEFTTEIHPLKIGLIAYYPFDGDANDYSGNSNHGTNYGAALTTDRFGNSNSAYDFDGIDDYIVTNTNIDDNLNAGASFVAWIYLPEVGTYGRILSNYNGTGAPGDCVERIGFVFGVTNDQSLNIFYASDGNDYNGRITNTGDFEVNTWYHVVGTWDGTFHSTGFKLYINGVQSDTNDFETGNDGCGYLESDNPFHIGMGHCSIGECAPFNGSIDEVRIYNRALTEDEIQLIYHEGGWDE